MTSIFDELMSKDPEQLKRMLNRVAKKQTSGMNDLPISESDLANVSDDELELARKNAKALTDYDVNNTTDEIKSTSNKYKTKPDTMKRIVAKSATETGSPTNLKEFDALKQRQAYEKSLPKTFDPVLKKEAIRENLTNRYSAKLKAPEVQSDFAKMFGEGQGTVRPSSFDGPVDPQQSFDFSVDPIEAAKKTDQLELDRLSQALKTNPSLLEKLKGFPKGFVEKLSTYGENTGKALSKAGPYLGALGTAVESTNAIKQFDDAQTADTLLGKLGAGSKGVGSSLNAGAGVMALTPGGQFPAAATAVLGTGIQGIGEGVQSLDQLNKNFKDPKNIEAVRDLGHAMQFGRKQGTEQFGPATLSNADSKDLVKNLSDDELSQLIPERNRPEGIANIDEIKAYARQVAEQRGIDPALFLAQLEQESNFNPAAVSKTGAKGIGQMFPAAFMDAKQFDPSLQDLQYHDLVNPTNWKKQIDASAAYGQVLKNRYPGETDEQLLRRYNAGGGKTTPEDPTKGYEGTDARNYSKRILQLQNKYRDTNNMAQAPQLNRSPGSIPSDTPEVDPTKQMSLDSIKVYLQAAPGTDLGDKAPLDFGPSSDGDDYSDKLNSLQRLTQLRDRYNDINSVNSQSSPSGQGVSEQQEVNPIEKQIADYMQAEQGRTMASQENLQDAQDRSAKLQMIAGLMKAGKTIGTGLTGVGGLKPTQLPEGVEGDILKSSEDPIKRYKEQVANEDMDPKSAASTQYRQFTRDLLKKAGLSDGLVSENASKNALEKMFPIAATLYKSKQDNDIELQKAKATINKKGTPGLQALDRDYVKEYNDWTSNGKTQLAKNIERLENVKSVLEKRKDDVFGTSGRITGNLHDFFRSEESIRLRDDIHAAAVGALRATLGPQFTENEGKRIMDMAYNEKLSPEQNIEKINLAIKELRANEANNDRKAGHFEEFETLGGYKSDTNPTKVDSADEHNEALDWAKKNPNDPRAKQILQMHGAQ